MQYDIRGERHALRGPVPGAEARDTAHRSRPSAKVGQGAVCRLQRALWSLLNLARSLKDHCGPSASIHIVQRGNEAQLNGREWTPYWPLSGLQSQVGEVRAGWPAATSSPLHLLTPLLFQGLVSVSLIGLCTGMGCSRHTSWGPSGRTSFYSWGLQGERGVRCPQ